MEEREANGWAWRGVYAVALAAVLILFLLSLQGILNPVVLFLLLLLFSSPFAGTRTHLLVVIGTGLLTGVWLLSTLGSMLAPFFLALGFAYVLRPAVRRIEGERISRGLAITLLALPLIALVGVALFVGIPALARQLSELVQQIPAALQSLTAWLERAQLEFARRDLPLVNEQSVLARLRSIRPETLLQQLQGQQSEIARRAWTAVVGAGRGISGLLTILGYVFLTPILTFYLLRDWDRIAVTTADLVPSVSRQRVLAFFAEYDRLLGGYLRGNFLEGAMVGALTAVGLWALGIPSALLLGVMAAVFNVIPYLGLVLTLIPALVVALFTANVLLSLGKVVLVFAVVQALDGAVIGPKIVGESVGLHPVWVILALSIGGFFWGFVGLLLAVPLAVLLKLLLHAGLDRYRASSLFRGAPA